MQDLYNKLLEANGIIFGTPLYFYSMTAQSKTIVDRTIALNHPGKSLTNKVGRIIVVGGSLGLIQPANEAIVSYCSSTRIITAISKIDGSVFRH